MKTQISTIDDLNKSSLDPNILYNNANNRILAYIPVLARIIRGCIPEFNNFEIDEIQNRWIDTNNDMISQNDTRFDGKASASHSNQLDNQDIVFDFLVPANNDVVRIIVTIEAQNKFTFDYPMEARVIYYSRCLISSVQEFDFVHQNFNNIKKVYSIWICSSPPVQYHNTITSYSIIPTFALGKSSAKLLNYDSLKNIVVCLGADNKKVGNETLDFLNVLFSTNLTVTEKKSVLKKQFNFNISEIFEKEINETSNLSVGICEEEIREDIGKGRKEGKVETIANIMQNTGFSVENVMSMMSIPKSEYDYYREHVDEYLHNFKDNLKS